MIAATSRVRRLLAVTGPDRHLLVTEAGTTTEAVDGAGTALPEPEPS